MDQTIFLFYLGTVGLLFNEYLFHPIGLHQPGYLLPVLAHDQLNGGLVLFQRLPKLLVLLLQFTYLTVFLVRNSIAQSINS